MGVRRHLFACVTALIVAGGAAALIGGTAPAASAQEASAQEASGQETSAKAAPTRETPARSASAQAAPDSEHGRQVFEYWCAPCHAPGPGHPGTQSLELKYGGSLPGPLEEREDLTPAVVRTFVRQGILLMAPFRKTEITDAELEDLAAYLSQ